MALKANVFECNHWVSVSQHLHPFGKNQSLALLMEKVEDSCDGKKKEVKIKRVRGMSLRACVDKAAGWTLEKANSTTSQEANINKAQ